MINIIETINEEKKKNLELLDYYQNIKNSIPKGTIEIKEIKGEKYIYLKYRDKNAVVSKYCGKLDDNQTLIEKIEKRRHAEIMLKRIKKEIENIERIEKYANISWK